MLMYRVANPIQPDHAPWRDSSWIGQARPAATDAQTLEQLKAQKLSLLRTGAAEILNTAAKVIADVNGTYVAYRDRATPAWWKRALAAATGYVGVSIWTWIQGDANKEALARLAGARKLGYDWIKTSKAKWFTESPTVNLHAELINEDPELAERIDVAFENVVMATGNVVDLIGDIESLPETVVYQSVTAFFGRTWRATENMINSLGQIGRAIEQIMIAIGRISEALARGAEAAAKGAEKFPVIATVVAVVGLGLIAYIALK